MEVPQFDATLGGTEHLPPSANSLKFAASRSIEIAAMTESILRPSKTKLIFQTLPVHMRRRVMSHNSKRLPIKLRQGHLEQLKKSGLPPKQKRPSRKYRRRPKNLLEEYNRRKQRNVWLESHIWHAKRFHMIERWGYRLAYAPCDKAFRACYRATSKHCLIQDISYYVPFQIIGPLDIIKNLFNGMTNSSCGLSICAKAYLSGKREGRINLYKPNMFPYGYIGRIQFIWVNSDNNTKQCLWLFVHPSQAKELESVLKELCLNTTTTETEAGEKRRKLTNIYSEKLEINIMPGAYNRFQMTGPNSHAILARSLKCIDNVEKIQNNEWVLEYNKLDSELHIQEKCDYWNSIRMASSPSQFQSSIVLGLVVKDPRLMRPLHRTKAQHENKEQISIETLINIPTQASSSPLWNTAIHETIKKNRKTNSQFIEHITKTQLVPGEINENDTTLQSVPIVLVQRPGSQNPDVKKIGYGNGWDIIVPSGYGLPFWQTFIMYGARSGGLRESENLTYEMGETYLSPDSIAGTEENKRREIELRETYFKLPPSKRVNYIKLAVTSPFICPWNILLSDWSHTCVDNFYVLRDRQLLMMIQDCMIKNKLPSKISDYDSCLLPVCIQVLGKGNLRDHAMICIPQPGDCTVQSVLEPHHTDPNEKLRKQKRLEHIKCIKQKRRKRVSLKKKGVLVKSPTKPKKIKELSEYVISMRELWLPSHISSIRNSASREIMGFVSHGAFSFTEACSCGVGYIAYNALTALLANGHNKVLVRNNTSRKYTLAKIKIIS